ncbi:MAG: 1-aminocyclopropane-1-carboxylate deaminase [Bacteroidetes bacterium]|nr:MAG: 1-aminocyclopropane-1-carboxylate deaminase [Bacteroidota bacterium]
MNILNHLTIPSPLTQVKTSWSIAAGIELWLKRDDLIHPIISGNKWRKLSGIFEDYNREDYNGIITFGGAYSNHLVATAASCAIMELPCIGMIRGEEPKEWNPVLKLCKLYGMKLQFISREEYKRTNRQEGIKDNRLYIPEGGASKLGMVGCADILNEIDLTNVSKIFVACGTGTTIAGMATYLEKSENNHTKLYGIQVLKGERYIANDIKKQYDITSVHIYDEFHGGGYAKTNEELISFIKEFTRETGVLLDPIYTGKLMLAIKKLVERKEISGERIVAIHTGGLTGWFGKVSDL